MTEQDKQLLLIDLCWRLPYGVKVQDEFGRINKLVIGNADLIRLFYNDFSIYGENALSLPFLRPLSSMTEEEVKEFYGVECMDAKVGYIKPTCNWHFTINGIDWLNTHHFDYRGLIERGLAIEVTKDNNPYKV